MVLTANLHIYIKVNSKGRFTIGGDDFIFAGWNQWEILEVGRRCKLDPSLKGSAFKLQPLSLRVRTLLAFILNLVSELTLRLYTEAASSAPPPFRHLPLPGREHIVRLFNEVRWGRTLDPGLKAPCFQTLNMRVRALLST